MGTDSSGLPWCEPGTHDHEVLGSLVPDGRSGATGTYVRDGVANRGGDPPPQARAAGKFQVSSSQDPQFHERKLHAQVVTPNLQIGPVCA